MIEPIVESLKPLVEDELERANAEYEPFHNDHEGYAVILEEVEEAEEVMEVISKRLDGMWYLIKTNQTPHINFQVEVLEERALCLAAEAIQVAAMCEKYNQMRGTK